VQNLTTPEQEYEAERRHNIERWIATVTGLLMELGCDAGKHADVQRMIDAYNAATHSVWSID
jgi:hypothetical protein